MLSELLWMLLVCFRDSFSSFSNKGNALVLEAYQKERAA